MSNSSQQISATISFVKTRMQAFDASHDWYHVERVWKNAKQICQKENVDSEIVELAAILHDVIDRKYFKGSPAEGQQLIRNHLQEIELSDHRIQIILDIINNMSFSKNGKVTSPEQRVVQDADRLDAIGAIGIARCIYYAAKMDNPIHLPGILGEYEDISAYRKNGSSTAISHFYDKLLKIKNTMLTTTGQKIAEERHRRLITYLNDFLSEWEGTS